MEKIVPEILNKVVEFIKYFDNPDDEKGEYKSIKIIQLRIYDVSMGFIFKWIVSEEEVRAASEYTGIPIDGRRIGMSLSEYNIELEYELPKTEN